MGTTTLLEKEPMSTTQTGTKYVFFFGAGKAEGNGKMKDVLGGKGAGLAEMTNAGLPVPPGFTITTEACRAFYANGSKFPDGMWEQTMAALHTVEGETGKKPTTGTHRLRSLSHSYSLPSSVSRMNLLSSREKETRGSASNAEGDCGKPVRRPSSGALPSAMFGR